MPSRYMNRVLSAEEITGVWGEKCPDFEPGCPCCQMWAMHDEIEDMADEAEGLKADLDDAVRVAFNRGATEWTLLNYPDHYKRFTEGKLQ